MVTPTPPRNPFDPNDYVLFEEQGFEWIYVGLMKVLVPKRKVVGFLSKEFQEDNARLGIDVGYSNGQFFGTISFGKIYS